MSGAGEMLRGWFVVMPEAVAHPPGRVAAPPPAHAVLASARDAAALGAALGLAVARERRAPCVLVCCWTGESGAGHGWRGPAGPAARRLAAGLMARGHDAVAAGRLVRVSLPCDADAAMAAARRAIAAAGTAPTVLAIGGPREATVDALLAEQDHVLIAGRPGDGERLAALAAERLDHRDARACTVDPTPPARAIASAGLAVLPCLRRAVAAVARGAT